MFEVSYEDCEIIWTRYIRYNKDMKFNSNDFVNRALIKLGKPIFESDDKKIIRRYYMIFKKKYNEKYGEKGIA